MLFIVLQEIKKKFNYLNFFKDDFLVFDNLSIHSSWMINLNIYKRFRYIDLNPEDYASLSFYMRRNFKLNIIKANTVVYNDNPEGMSKKINANDNIIGPIPDTKTIFRGDNPAERKKTKLHC